MQTKAKPRKYTGKYGRITYRLNGKCHREDGPAIIEADGSQIWYLNGKCHRLDGPAVIQADGTQEWWLNNTKYSFDNFCKQKVIIRRHNIPKT